MQENLNHIIESLLFVSEDPLTVDKLKNILETVDTKEIKASLQSLAEQYDSRGGGFKLAQVAGGWQLRSRPEYNEWIKRMLQPPPQRLSKAALETLAIVAYNQPIIRADIEHIRGVDCGGVLRQLLERKLIRVLGRKEIPGRPLIYATTKLFLELFELKDLKDLPTPKEIEEMSTAAEETHNTPVPEVVHTVAPLVIHEANDTPTEGLPKMRFSFHADSDLQNGRKQKPPKEMTDDQPEKIYGACLFNQVFFSSSTRTPQGQTNIRFIPARVADIGSHKLPDTTSQNRPGDGVKKS